MPGPMDPAMGALKAQRPMTAATPVDPTEALIHEQMMMRQKMGGQQPEMPMGPTNIRTPQGNMFQLQSRGPDMEGLIRAMQIGGMTGSRTSDIELDPAAQPAEAALDFDELMRRSKAITGY